MKKPHLQDKYSLFIDGQWKDASDGATYDTFCPANGERLATCAEATKEDVDTAVKAATQAWQSWKNTDPIVRANLLLKI